MCPNLKLGISSFSSIDMSASSSIGLEAKDEQEEKLPVALNGLVPFKDQIYKGNADKVVNGNEDESIIDVKVGDCHTIALSITDRRVYIALFLRVLDLAKESAFVIHARLMTAFVYCIVFVQNLNNLPRAAIIENPHFGADGRPFMNNNNTMRYLYYYP